MRYCWGGLTLNLRTQHQFLELYQIGVPVTVVGDGRVGKRSRRADVSSHKGVDFASSQSENRTQMETVVDEHRILDHHQKITNGQVHDQNVRGCQQSFRPRGKHSLRILSLLFGMNYHFNKKGKEEEIFTVWNSRTLVNCFVISFEILGDRFLFYFFFVLFWTFSDIISDFGVPVRIIKDGTWNEFTCWRSR